MKKSITRIISILFFLILLGLDQLTKFMAVLKLKDKNAIRLLDDNFELLYLENSGAAWGIFAYKTTLLIIVTGFVFIALIYFYERIPSGKKFVSLRFCMLLILSGALGNMTDRILHKYVIDFLYVKIIDFPVFNVADIYVSVGAFLFVILFVFIYNEDELSFFFERKKVE